MSIPVNFTSDVYPEFPPSQPDWNNIDVIHRKTLPPRSDFYHYSSEAAALTRDISQSRALCLSGTWKFHHSPNPFAGPSKFYSLKPDDLPSTGFVDIAVPGMWQLQGHGKPPHYTNVIYPWPVDPPNVPLEDNECGRYVRTFSLDEEEDVQLRLRFEGVDSAFTVWLNGKDVGYSQGSRNPSEFDVSKFVVRKGENVLAVEVYQRCDASYIEDQDQWWLSGIFRDVYLHKLPKIHINDFHVETRLDSGYRDATLSVRMELSFKSPVEVKLLDSSGDLIEVITGSFKNRTVVANVSNPGKWTAETPTLYTLVINIEGSSVAQRIGFRDAGLVNNVFCVNGKPVKFRGVNRHEHHPDHGRTVPYEFLRQDLLLMKTHNINAIRTAHQPNDTRLYDLADELGLWVMDEADLECHGFDQVGGNPPAYTSDNPAWEAQYVDRARQLVARDRNHACVLMWSLGNEAFYGRNHQAMYDAIKEMDQTRLVHYEGDWWTKTVDMYSRMYPSIRTIVEDFAMEEAWTKPLVLCEFLHAMGNSCGNAKEYVEAFYKYPRLMGGFVWEWANHGLRTKTKDGIEYMAYGGDFGDVPNDGNFIMDGMVFSDHTPCSNLIEYGKAIEPVQTLSLEGTEVTIINRYDHIGLEDLVCTWKIITADGDIAGGEVDIPKNVDPHRTAKLTVPFVEHISYLNSEALLHLDFTLRSATNWAPESHRVAFGQLSLRPPPRLASLVPPINTARVFQNSPTTLMFKSPGSTWTFSLTSGLLTSWTRGAGNILTQPPVLDFYRALTDNDRGGHGKDWLKARLNETEPHIRKVGWYDRPCGPVIHVNCRIAPPVLAWAVDAFITYEFYGDSVSLRVKGRPTGQLLPSTFARIGFTLGLSGVDAAKWWGRGPGESYCDKKLSQAVGNWESSVDNLWVDYEFPQDGGNRTDVRDVSFMAGKEKVLRARFGDLPGASFSAMRYDTKDIDECTHPYELHKRRREDVIIRLDWKHHGQGGGSCGPATLEEYQLKSEEFDFQILLD